MKRLLLFLSLSLSILSGCSGNSSEIAGGGGFEGETIALGGTVTFSGHPLADAEVDFISLRSNALLTTSRTTASGAFSLRIPQDSAGALEIRSGDTALAHAAVESPSTTLSLTALRPIAWTARLLVSGVPAANAAVQIVGSRRSAVADAQGRIVLPRLPDPQEWITVTLADGSKRDALLPPLTDSSIDLPDHPVVLLDDGEGKDGRTSLGRLVGGGWWFAITDAQFGGSGSAFPDGILSTITKLYTSDSAYAGTSLRIGFRIDPYAYYHFGELGIAPSDSNSWTDLSSMDSLVFHARGSGTVRVVFLPRISVSPTLDTIGFFGADIELHPEWTRYAIRREDILAPEGSRPVVQGIPWSTAAARVHGLAFAVTDTASLELDQLELHGPRLPELVPIRE